MEVEGAVEVEGEPAKPTILTYPPRGDILITMFRPQTVQERILHRLKISQGHLKKVISMLESDAYCIDVLHQSQALRSALEETENLIMSNHLESCVAEDIKKGHGKKAIAEVMSVIQHRN